MSSSSQIHLGVHAKPNHSRGQYNPRDHDLLTLTILARAAGMECVPTTSISTMAGGDTDGDGDGEGLPLGAGATLLTGVGSVVGREKLGGTVSVWPVSCVVLVASVGVGATPESVETESVGVGATPESVEMESVTESVGSGPYEIESVGVSSSEDEESVGSSVHVGLSVGDESVGLGTSVALSVGTDSVSDSVGNSVSVVNAPDWDGSGLMTTVMVSYSVSVGSGTSSVHVEVGLSVGSDEESVGTSVGVGSDESVGTESVGVSVGTSFVAVSVGTSVAVSVGADSLALSVDVEVPSSGAGEVTFPSGGEVTPKSTLTWLLPMSVCASAKSMHPTKSPLSEPGTARHVLFPVQGVISQFPSGEQLASWEEMQETWPDVHGSSRCRESKKKLVPCACSAGVVGCARTARAAKRDQMGMALTVDVSRSAAVTALVVENMLIGGGLVVKCKTCACVGYRIKK